MNWLTYDTGVGLWLITGDEPPTDAIAFSNKSFHLWKETSESDDKLPCSDESSEKRAMLEKKSQRQRHWVCVCDGQQLRHHRHSLEPESLLHCVSKQTRKFSLWAALTLRQKTCEPIKALLAATSPIPVCFGSLGPSCIPLIRVVWPCHRPQTVLWQSRQPREPV